MLNYGTAVNWNVDKTTSSSAKYFVNDASKQFLSIKLGVHCTPQKYYDGLNSEKEKKLRKMENDQRSAINTEQAHVVLVLCRHDADSEVDGMGRK